MAFSSVDFHGNTYSIPGAKGDTGYSGTYKVDGLLVALATYSVTLNGTQTLTNKTLTNPTINDAVWSGTISGNVIVSGTLSIGGAITASNLTASQVVITNASKVLSTVAYDSANTASALVQRDGSGNFSANNITSALTGTASGNTNYTPNQYGVVLSGSANAMVVLAPDSSTTKVLVCGGASANPSWGIAYASANTVSTLVSRDGSGNFSAGTITATLTGNVTGNVTGNLTGNVTGSVTGNVTGNCSGTSATFTGALSGDVTSSAMVTTAAATQANIVTLSKSTGVAVHGTNTNDSAAAGYVGEYIESTVTSPTNTGATNAYYDVTSISLTAGDWDVTGWVDFQLNTGVGSTFCLAGISTTTGNDGTGLTQGVNAAASYPPTTVYDNNVVLPAYRKSLSATTTIYLKGRINYPGGGQPQHQGRLSARRVR